MPHAVSSTHNHVHNVPLTAGIVPSSDGSPTDPTPHRRGTKVVVFGIRKGGTGKSTLTASTAVCAVQRGLSVIVLDLDPRGDLKAWGSARAGASPEVAAVDASGFGEMIQSLRRDAAYDLILIDTAGNESLLNEMAMCSADLCLVPFGQSIFDVRSALQEVEHHKRCQREFALILTRCPPNQGRTVAIRSALTRIGEFAGVPFVARVAHLDAMAQGLGVTELDPDCQAATEVEALWSWIETKLPLVRPGL